MRLASVAYLVNALGATEPLAIEDPVDESTSANRHVLTATHTQITHDVSARFVISDDTFSS